MSSLLMGCLFSQLRVHQCFLILRILNVHKFLLFSFHLFCARAELSVAPRCTYTKKFFNSIRHRRTLKRPFLSSKGNENWTTRNNKNKTAQCQLITQFPLFLPSRFLYCNRVVPERSRRNSFDVSCVLYTPQGRLQMVRWAQKTEGKQSFN